jgi:glutamate--glyoxylate aminotransferase
VTFHRQVQALVLAPFLQDHPSVGTMFPADAVARARRLTAAFNGAIGAYTDSRGAAGIRQEVADFIHQRDGHAANPDNIFLTSGASAGVSYVLNAMIRDADDAVLVPIPQYPLYSATLQLLGGTLLPYYLKEDAEWGMDLDEIRRSILEARARGLKVRALVFINPGNPTGQCLSADNLQDLVKLAHDEGLVLLADEVYQTNIYQDEKPFLSAKKIMCDLGEPYANSVELVSFHTVSKGVLGECGLRGGYMELVNFHPETVAQLYKTASINLCPNTVGQVAVSLMVNPPKPEDESFELYAKETGDQLASLRRRAHVMTESFNSLEGVTCNFTEGAMYSFPQLHLPPKAIEAAKEAGKTPDTFYCLQLLEETGIVTVPGSGFGQVEGTFHLRTTILPREEKIQEFVKKFKVFHEGFMAQYGK